jgi:hypothetical protein
MNKDKYMKYAFQHPCNYHYDDEDRRLMTELLNLLMQSKLDISIEVDADKYSSECNGYHNIYIQYGKRFRIDIANNFSEPNKVTKLR